MLKRNSGMVLAMVLMCISVMSMLMYGISQIVASQQKSASNYVDVKIAENYAIAAVLDAESRVYFFDLNNQLESPPIDCNSAVDALGGDKANYAGASCLSIRRGWRLKNLANSVGDLLANGVNCNAGNNNLKGFCFNNSLSVGANTDVVFDSDIAWQPWAINSGLQVSAPCNTYSNPQIPLLDDKASRYTIEYKIAGKDFNSLCANPRYIIEPINLDYRGLYNRAIEDFGSYESDINLQQNGASITLYKMSESLSVEYDQSNPVAPLPLIPSARLYRITAVAFGKNGDTKVMLQEIVAINNFNPNPFEQRESKDTESNIAYRIQRISTQWIR